MTLIILFIGASLSILISSEGKYVLVEVQKAEGNENRFVIRILHVKACLIIKLKS